MKNVIRYSIAAAGLAAGLSAGVATQAAGLSNTHLVPSASTDEEYARVVNITPGMSNVIVSPHETVKFVDTANGQSFVVDFDEASFNLINLNMLAPTGALEHSVTAYVTDPDEINTD